MIFSKRQEIPKEVSKAGLGRWYSELNETDKVKIGRYLDGSGGASATELILSIMRKANLEENHGVAVLAGECLLKDDLKKIERFDLLEEMIPAYFGIRRYDDCLKCCREGIEILCGNIEKIKERNGGSLPDRIMCRSYTINVLVGAYGDYDAGDKALDEFFEMGIISEEDLRYRKQSHKIHKLQRTFDGIFSVKLKDQ